MKKREESELLVIVKAKDLGNYIFTVTDKSPKKFRFSLISRLQNLALSMIENLYRANMVFIKDSKAVDKIEVRKKYQREAYVDLKLLNYIALMAKEQGGILAKH